MNEKEITIRKASYDDAEELLKIYTPYVNNTAISFEYEVPSLEEFRGRIANTLKRYPYLVAEYEGEIVGYAYAGAFKSRAAYDWAVETTVYVRQDERRNGIGRKLYAALEEILKKQGILNMNACIAVPEGKDEHLTKDSPAFHEKMGFRMVGTFHKCGYKFNHWYDMVWMEKKIGEHLGNQPPIISFRELK
jgi:L-amino acid N-acyltransferase YncA